MKSPTSWSIRTHLLAFVVIVILPFLGLFIHGQVQRRKEILETTHQRMMVAAELAGLREESLVGEVRQTLATLAQLPSLDTPERSRYLPLFQQVLRQNPYLDNLFYSNTTGRVLLSGGALKFESIAQRPYFQHVVAQRRPFVGEFTIAKDTGHFVLPVAYPTSDRSGRFSGVLVTGISVAFLGKSLPTDLGIENATLEILDHRGHLLYTSTGGVDLRYQFEDPDYMNGLAATDQAAILRDQRTGTPQLHGLRRLQLNPDRRESAWIRIIVPERPLLSRAWKAFYRNLAILGALGAALIALAWWIGAVLIATPISRLVTVAQRMSEGRFTVKTGLAEGTNEVGRVARAFEHLGVRLKVRERQLRQAVARAEEISGRFEDLEAHTPDGVFWIQAGPDDDFVFDDVNPAFEQEIGKSRAELLGKTARDIFEEEPAGQVLEHYRRCRATGRPDRIRGRLSRGERNRLLELQLIPLRGTTGRMVGFCRDITEATAAEEALRQSQKLKSLGMLAGGIAHDFNNLLTAILGNLNLAQIKLGTVSPAAAFMDNIERTVLRASELTRQLLAYSGRGHFVVKPLDISATVLEMTHLLEVSISKKIHLDYRFAENLPLIEADAAQIQQVVMNLVTNASDAIGDRVGFIGITTRCTEINEGFISATFPDQAIEPGLFVILEVSDNGCGMSRKVLEHIFDPFFTTKPNGKGLGLSAMLGILRGHRAGIKIYSEIAKGTVFKLFFPAARDAVLPPDYVSPALPIQAEGTILVVDDEPDIRENACLALESLGFTVLTAADGLEAVEVYREYQPDIRAVLMDLTMPRLDGKEAFQQILAMDPKACIILSSGYSEQDIRLTFGEETPAGFIQKPYHIKEMQHAIVDCLRLWARTGNSQ